MRSLYTLVFAFICTFQIFAQVGESASHSPISQLPDSINRSIVNASDSIVGLTDSLSLVLNKASSGVDSLRRLYDAKASVLTNLTTGLEHKLDSLNPLGKASRRIQAKVDSLKGKLNDLQRNLSSKIDSTRTAALDKISKVQLPPELEQQRQKAATLVRQKMPRVNTKLNIPGVNIPGANLEGSQALMKKVNLPQGNLPNTHIPAAAPGGLTNGVAALPEISESAIQEKAEQTVSTLIDKESIDGQLADMPIPTDFSEDAMKEQLATQVRAVAINHFAGHEKEIEAAMNQLSKYKKKYESVVNTAQILKVKKNAMKGKPLIERLRPGIMMQFSNRNGDWTLDLNAYVGYRITERLSAGPGWNQRLAYTVDRRRFNHPAIIYGPRVFAEFDAWKGFCPRIEGEVMMTHTDFSKLSHPTDPDYSNWVWGAFVGLKKAYRIAGRLNGSSCVMTRVFNPDGQSPYPSQISVRIGFEFAINGGKKAKVQGAEN